MLGISDMTLNSFGRTECANLKRTNECIGIEEMCVIIKKKKECKYFKTCVLPIAEHQGIYSKILSEYSDMLSLLTQQRSFSSSRGFFWSEIPSSVMTANSQLSLELKSTQPRSKGSYVISCHKPILNRNFGSVHHSTCGHRGLITTVSTLK